MFVWKHFCEKQTIYFLEVCEEVIRLLKAILNPLAKFFCASYLDCPQKRETKAKTFGMNHNVDLSKISYKEVFINTVFLFKKWQKG